MSKRNLFYSRSSDVCKKRTSLKSVKNNWKEFSKKYPKTVKTKKK